MVSPQQQGKKSSEGYQDLGVLAGFIWSLEKCLAQGWHANPNEHIEEERHALINLSSLGSNSISTKKEEFREDRDNAENMKLGGRASSLWQSKSKR